MERITSRANPLCAQIKKLNGSRSARREQGLFVGEGPKLLAEAFGHGLGVTAVVTAEGTEIDCPYQVRRVEMPQGLFQSLADTKTPQGVLFLCRMPAAALPDKLAAGHYLVLDGVQDPGNVGTIWRTADAFGAEGVVLLHGCADPWGPKTVRATMGACFRLPVWEAGLDELGDKLAAAELPLYATALRDDTQDVRDVALDRCAVVIGSEGRGVAGETLARCSKTLKIPMRARCESLNAAAASTVVLWEMARGVKS